jgi:CheY-like chemotaxis protein
MKFLRRIIPANIEIQTRIDEHAGTVIADAAQVQQVGMNLCTNAVHAMEASGGRLEISLAGVWLDEESARSFQNIAPGRYARLTVSDTGPGIAPEISDRIFDPFFTTKPTGKGTGLGLSVVDGIVRDHGGAVAVESTPGRGASFSVLLPAVEARETAPPEPAKNSIPGGTERILLVDDEESIAVTMNVMLSRLGYAVTVTSSSNEAIETFKENPHGFDLVITDLTMPGMTGDQLAAEALAVRPDIPVILMTGYNDLIGSDRIKMQGITEIMPKPCKKPEIANTVRRVLDGHSSR